MDINTRSGELEDTAHDATQFAASFRGQYVISQALSIASDILTSGPLEKQEPSNAADMDYLRKNIFGMYSTPEEIMARLEALKEHEALMQPNTKDDE